MNVSWKLASAAALALANLAAGQIVALAWKKVTGHEPPADGEEAAQASLMEVVLFGVLSGVVVAVFQRIAMKKANKWFVAGSNGIAGEATKRAA